MATITLTWIHNYVNSNGAELYKQTDIEMSGITWNYRKWRWNKNEIQTNIKQNASFEFMKTTTFERTRTSIHGNTLFVYLRDNLCIRLCLLLDTVILLRAEVGEISGDGDWDPKYDFGAKVVDDFGDAHFIRESECNLFK